MTEDLEKQEVLFENAFTMTKERYLQLCKHPKATNAIKRLRKWKILQSLALLFALGLAIVGILQKEFYLAAIGVSFFLAFSYKRFFQLNHQNKKTYMQIRKSLASAEWNRITRFYEMGIQCQDMNVFSVFAYQQIDRVTDDGKECLLRLGDDFVLRLRHSEFTVGSYEDFAAFLHRKLAENAENEAAAEEQSAKEKKAQDPTVQIHDD